MTDADHAGGPASGGGSLGLDERAELERLRAEVTRLYADPAVPARRPHVGWRSPVAVVLIVVGCLLAPVSVLAVWTANQVSSTSRYVANVEPLVHDPAVQNALTDKLTTEITTHLNVTAYTDQAASLLTSHGLPRVGALLQTFGPSISSSVTGFIHGKLPAINPTLSLFSAKYLVKAQTGYRLINDLKIVLPIVALLFLASGVYVARSHRRALIGAGLGLAASMLVLGAGLVIFRGVYLNGVPNDVLPADAAASLFDTLVRFIKEGLRTILVAGLVIAAGAFLTGPSVSAVTTRRAITSGLAWLRQSGEHAGLRTGAAGTWTYTHRRGVRISAVALAALLFVFAGQPSVPLVIVIVAALLVVLGLIELLGSRPPAQPAAL